MLLRVIRRSVIFLFLVYYTMRFLVKLGTFLDALMRIVNLEAYKPPQRKRWQYCGRLILTPWDTLA